MLRWLRSAPFLGGLGRAHEPSAAAATHPTAATSPAAASTPKPQAEIPAAGLGLASHAPTTKAGALVQSLAAQDPDGFSTIKLVAQPTTISPTRATYRLGGPDGLRLRAGEQVYLELPPELRGRAVYQAVIEHRQVQSEKSSVPSGAKKWDQTPGVTALHFHTLGETEAGGWRFWHAPWGSSGTDGGKYAEIRPDWECESHFDFARNGTVPVGGGKARHDVLRVDALRLRGVGDDPTFVREVTITLAPPAPTHTDELVFTPGTSIGDLLTAYGQHFGKDFDNGTYPGALALLEGGDGGAGVARLGAKSGWTIEDGRLSIPLVPGKTFTGVEIACGDTKPDGKLNSDGDVGTQGHSRLKMGLLRAGASEPEWFVHDHGVPPKGVLFGGPTREHVAKPGDRLILAADVDPTYVMAVRLGYTG